MILKRWLLTLAICSGLLLVWAPSASSSSGTNYSSSHPWIKLWSTRDQSLYHSTRVAANIFRVSQSWLAACNRSEGGNTARETLRVTISNPYAYDGKGWNTQGSYAFGPWQFMLGSKPPYSSRQWGTFGSYVHSAFSAAKRRGYAVPYRFKRPDSFVGQAITTAYMFAIGQSGRWTGRGC